MLILFSASQPMTDCRIDTECPQGMMCDPQNAKCKNSE